MKLAKMMTPGYSGVTFILPEAVENWCRYQCSNAQSVLVEGLCGYDIGAGWNPAKCGNPEPCREHAALVCTCGLPAKFACANSDGQFICGQPVCEKHRLNCGKHLYAGANTVIVPELPR